MIDEAGAVLGASVAAVALVVEGGGVLVRSSMGVSEEVLSRWKERRLDDRTVLTDVVRTGRPIVISSLAEYAVDYPHTLAEVGTFGLQAVAGFPLRIGDRVLGAVTFIFARSRDFSRDEVSFMETIAGQAAQAVERTELSEKLRAQAAVLATRNEELSESDRRKSEFLAVLSHELRNPLTPIRNSLYILGRATPGGAQASRAHAVIERQVAHMARLVDDLIDITRISRGKIRLQRAHVDLGDLVQRTVEDHHTVLERHEVEVTLPDAALWVDGDPTRLAQVVGNLLNNAAKFTPPGGRVSVSLRRAADSAVLEVADTGLGIDAETRARLFEPFAQADRSLDRSPGGLGLGLALVKGMIELHGGAVSAHSDGAGRGARFTVKLPLDERSTAARDAAQARETAGRVRRVLIIEDNADAADTLAAALGLSGHEVSVAYDAEQGLARARELRPDVVVCDIGLPGTDGYAVARALRLEATTAEMYLVALTGYAQPEDQRRALNAGFDAHVAKPPDIAVLERILLQARGPLPGSSADRPPVSRGPPRSTAPRTW